jgi:hypothetical protein
MTETFSAAPPPRHSSPARITLYQIRLAGILDESWQDWFDDAHLSHDPVRNETLLTGAFADQAALHGLLAKIRDLDLQLIELRRIEHESKT